MPDTTAVTASVVASAELSRGSHDIRYVVVDSYSGDVLDDGHGNGYRSARNARRAYAYARMTPAQKKIRDAMARRVAAWCEMHPEFTAEIDTVRAWAERHGEQMSADQVQQMLQIRGLSAPFGPEELLAHR